VSPLPFGGPFLKIRIAVLVREPKRQFPEREKKEELSYDVRIDLDG